jgi:serine protease
MNLFSFPFRWGFHRGKHVLGASALMFGLGASALGAAAAEQPVGGLVVVLRPGAVDVADTAVPLALSATPQAVRERAQRIWESRQAVEQAHLDGVARAAGVPGVRTGSAGSALRLDFSQPLAGEALQAAMRRLRLHPDVLDVVPNVRVPLAQTAAVTPSDALFAQQWALQPPASQAAGLNMPSAWARATGAASPVVVAVVDTGVRFDHPELAGHLLAGYDFVSEVDSANDGDGRDADASDPGDWVTAADARTSLYQGCDVSDSSWHGTAIAGLIAAASNNAAGIAGVNWGAQVLPVRVAGKCGAVLSDLLDGLRWAAGLPVTGAPANTHPAKVINLSFGGSGACDSAYQSTINDITAAGSLLVVAAGNAAAPLTRPADCANVLAVTAVRADGAKAEYASYGANVGLAAPGGSAISGSADAGVLSTVDSGRRGPVSSTYASEAGTSFAAPLTAGVASLMLSVQPTLTPADLMAKLRQAVRPHTTVKTLPSCVASASSNAACNCTTSTCGAGLLDADLALASVAAVPVSTTPVTPTPTPVSTSSSSQGGGGSTGLWWGLALWVWTLAAGGSIRRRKAG